MAWVTWHLCTTGGQGIVVRERASRSAPIPNGRFGRLAVISCPNEQSGLNTAETLKVDRLNFYIADFCRMNRRVANFRSSANPAIVLMR